MSKKSKMPEKQKYDSAQALGLWDAPAMALTATAVITPLAFTTMLYEQWHLPKIAVLRIGLGLTVALMVIAGGSQKKTSGLPRSSGVLLLFLAWVLLAALFSPDRNASLWGVYGHLEGVWGYVGYALAFFLAVRVYQKDQAIDSLALGVVVAGAVVSAYGLMQFLGLDVFSWGEIPFGTTRIFSTFGNPTYLATFLVAVIPLALTGAIKVDTTRMRRAYLSALGVVFMGLTLTFTRSAWIAAVVQLLLIVITTRPLISNKKHKWMIAAIIIIACVMTFMLVALSGGGSQTAKRITSTFNTSEGSVGSRVEIYKVAVKAIIEHPILGVGPDRFRYIFAQLRTTKYIIQKMHPQTPDDAHNYFLNLAATLGLPGLALFIIFFFWTWIAGWVSNAKRGLAGLTRQAWLVSAAGVLIALMFTPSEVGGTFWLWFGLGVGAPVASFSNKSEVMATNIACTVIGVILAVTAAMMVTADSYYLKAIKFSENNPDEALNAVRKAVRAYPYADTYHLGNGRLALDKALYLKNEKLFTEAIDAFKSGTVKLPGSYSIARQMADAYGKGAYAFARRELYGDMLETLNKTLPLNPKDARAWELIADAEAGLGNNFEAQQALSRVKRFSPAEE